MFTSQTAKPLLFNIQKQYTGWNSERISRHIAYWAFWLLLYATMNSSNSNHSFGEWMRVELVIMTVKLPYTYFMIYFLVPRYLLRQQYYGFIWWTLVATSIGGTIIWSFYYYYWPSLIEYPTGGRFMCSSYFYKAIDLVYISTFPVIYKLYQHYLQQEAKNREMVEQKLHAELELLKHQLQPHFLFNTLNNLYSLIITNNKNSADVVLRLSNIMSYMLYECNAKFISLDKEIEHLKNYIELEKIRYGKRLSVSFEEGGDINGKMIAPLLLIGFVENAFKHGAGKQVDGAWIRLNLWVDKTTMYFMIENSVDRNEQQTKSTIPIKGGIGLNNVRKRLELLYPEKHHLKIESNDTFLVHLQLEL